MSNITEALKAVDGQDNAAQAELLAALINNDMRIRQQMTGQTAFKGEDVQRLGRIVGEYGLNVTHNPPTKATSLSTRT